MQVAIEDIFERGHAVSITAWEIKKGRVTRFLASANTCRSSNLPMFNTYEDLFFQLIANTNKLIVVTVSDYETGDMNRVEVFLASGDRIHWCGEITESKDYYSKAALEAQKLVKLAAKERQTAKGAMQNETV